MASKGDDSKDDMESMKDGGSAPEASVPAETKPPPAPPAPTAQKPPPAPPPPVQKPPAHPPSDNQGDGSPGVQCIYVFPFYLHCQVNID